MTPRDRQLLSEVSVAIEAVARSPVHPVPGGGVMLRLWLAGQAALDRPTAEDEGEEVGRW